MKKKGIKKLIGMFMAFCVSISSVMPASILANDNLSNDKIIIDEMYENTHVIVEAEKDQDGNDVFIQYNNGQFYEKVVVKKDNNELIITNNQQDEKNEIINLSDAIAEAEVENVISTNDIIETRINDKYMGSISFKASGIGNLKANVSYVGKQLNEVSYDIYGAERSLASWVGIVVSGLSLPSTIAGSAVAAWASRFGFVSAIGSVVLPDTHVLSNPIEYTITTTDITNGSGGRKGTIYTTDYIVEAEGDGKISKDHYWNSIDLTECWRTFSFGEIVYNSLFTYPNWDIVSWN